MIIANVKVKWSDPDPNPLPTDIRVDEGGWVYQIFRGENKVIGGTMRGSNSEQEVIDCALALCKKKGFTHAYVNNQGLKEIE